ncbi:MAG: HDIG domain-containing protein [Myxococcales bacterium]|nr:HDIG domain-containing protein [Myxococcales bacterium]
MARRAAGVMTAGEWISARLGVHTRARRVLAMVVFCMAAAALLTERRADLGTSYVEGSVAPRDILAPFAFPFVDETATEERRLAAAAAVLPLFDADADLLRRLQSRVIQAFDMARRRVDAGRQGGRAELSAADRKALVSDFDAALDVALPDDAMAALVVDGFSSRAEGIVTELVAVGMRWYVLRDLSELPPPGTGITLVAGVEGRRDESVLRDVTTVQSQEAARQRISLHVLEQYGSSDHPGLVQACATLARGLVRPNISLNTILTEERRHAAVGAVEPVRVEVRRGARVVRQGDVLDRRQGSMLATLGQADRQTGAAWRYVLWLGFVSVVTVATFTFARGTVRKFARKQVELEVMALVGLFVLAMARLAVSSSQVGWLAGQSDTSVLGLLVPVAGGAMLVRILVNSESALVFALVASLLSGAMMDQASLFSAWYMVTALVGAGAVGQARERLNVLRAGLLAGLVGAGLVLIVNLVGRQGGEAALAALGWESALRQVVAALVAGLLSAIITLGLVPVMELFGFLTDYKLSELANLNHPLLRRLMLQAPGTYHHSVIVGSLSEAACEAVGANALLARVSCYFHDIGKGVKPQYFVENQRDGQNRHDRLSPEQSAQLIINHVRDGGVLARQHKLPPPIYDNIFMHHGTGLIPYFYNRAKEQAGGQPVDEALFRYPGPKPNTREAGIIMLADKVEAACRTIKEPSEERMRAMIQAIINQVMADGQLEECPLTVRELYQIANSFVSVLLGIYHHRIEYPDTRAISSGGKFAPVPRQGTITLEIQNPLLPPRVGGRDPDPSEDYEAVEVPLPGRDLPDTDDA